MVVEDHWCPTSGEKEKGCYCTDWDGLPRKASSTSLKESITTTTAPPIGATTS
jgi:hypothetical protein